jgi:hypothetical protein
MAGAVHADLVAGGDAGVELVGEGLDRVPGPEERLGHVVAPEELHQPRDADLAGEQPAGDVVR